METDERREIVAALYQAGQPLSVCAELVGVSRATVARDLKAKGVERRGRGYPAGRRRKQIGAGIDPRHTPPVDLEEAAQRLRTRYAAAIDAGDPVSPSDLLGLARLEIVLENRQRLARLRELTAR